MRTERFRSGIDPFLSELFDQFSPIRKKCILRAGKQLSKHYSRFLERGDSLYDAYMKANPNAEGVPSTFYTIGREGQYWSEYQSTEIFTEQGQQTFYAWMPWAMERYNAYYTEPAAQQKWTLANERKTILGHECQKATCHWRGRDFEAWFAPNIPVVWWSAWTDTEAQRHAETLHMGGRQPALRHVPHHQA